MSFKNIVNPLTLESYDLTSNNGLNLLKQYVKISLSK